MTGLRPLRWGARLSLAAALILGGCVGFSPDGGMSPVTAIVATRLDQDVAKIGSDAEAASAEARVAGLLRRPLKVGTAVEVAFLRNKGLQADFNDLGVSEADYVKASLPPDPTLSLNFVTGQGDFELVTQVVAAVYALATLPTRQAIAGERFAAAQVRTAGRVSALASEVSRQYYVTVAAQEQVGFLDQAVSAAQASAEIAKQLGEAGNLNKLEQAREDVFYSELAAQRADVRTQAQAERERLTRLLGLWGPDIAFKLPAALPALPKSIPSARDIEAKAIRERLDLQAARHDLDALARQLGLTRVTRYVSDFNLLIQNDHEDAGTTGGSKVATATQSQLTRTGFVGELTIPVYDFGESKVRGAREAYLGAANRLAQRAIDARSQAREAYIRRKGKYDLARYYADHVLPLRKTILDQSTLQYNGMLVDVTQLLLDARDRVTSNSAAIAAKRDFFIAGADLKATLTGDSPLAGSTSTVAASAN